MLTTTTTTISINEDARARPRRFSEGMERIPLAPAALRIGRFSDGQAETVTPSVGRSGSFADGLVARPYAFEVPRVGSFGDSVLGRRRSLRVTRRRTVAPAEA